MKVILLISKRPEDLEFAQAAAAECQMPLLHVGTPEEARTRAAELTQPILIADVSSIEQLMSFRGVFRPMIGEGPDQISPNSVHILSTEPLASFPEYLRHSLFGHFVVRKTDNQSEFGRHYARVIHGVCENSDFKIEASAENSMQVRLQHSSDKNSVVELVHRFLVERDFNPRAANAIATVADELMLNAIHDAAELAEKRAPDPESRRRPLELKGRSAVDLRVAFDGEHVAITVTDHFGTLTRPALLSNIFKSFGTEYAIDTSLPGAGIGLANAFRCGGSLVYVTEPGVKTEATVMFKKTARYGELRKRSRFISVHLNPV